MKNFTHFAWHSTRALKQFSNNLQRIIKQQEQSADFFTNSSPTTQILQQIEVIFQHKSNNLQRIIKHQERADFFTSSASNKSFNKPKPSSNFVLQFIQLEESKKTVICAIQQQAFKPLKHTGDRIRGLSFVLLL